MKNYVFLFLSFTIFYVSAQDVPGDYISLRDELRTYGSTNDANVKMAGSPYINEEFLPGKIVVDGKQYQDVYLRFNALKDVMEIKVRPGDDEIFILPRIDKYSFQQEDKTFYLKDIITEEGEMLSGFLIKYYQDPKTLLVGKPTTKTKAAQAAETGYERAQPAKVDTYVHYYFSLDGEPVKRVKLREKDFRKILKGEKMKEYFAENKVKGLEDVMKMLEYYKS